MNRPLTKFGIVSNVFVRQMHFEKAGDIEIGHKHEYDHLTLLAKGKLSLKVNDEITEYTAPHMIFIKAEFIHEITALSDNTVIYCVHALRGEKTDDILDPEMVPKGGPELQKILQSLIITNA